MAMWMSTFKPTGIYNRFFEKGYKANCLCFLYLFRIYSCLFMFAQFGSFWFILNKGSVQSLWGRSVPRKVPRCGFKGAMNQISLQSLRENMVEKMSCEQQGFSGHPAVPSKALTCFGSSHRSTSWVLPPWLASWVSQRKAQGQHSFSSLTCWWQRTGVKWWFNGQLVLAVSSKRFFAIKFESFCVLSGTSADWPQKKTEQSELHAAFSQCSSRASKSTYW